METSPETLPATIPSEPDQSDLGSVWEEELFASASRRARRAWLVTTAALGLSAIALGHSLVTLTRHSVEPVIITLDKVTGLAEVRARLSDTDLASDEAVTQSLIYRYVRDRETYDAADNATRIERVYETSTGQASESLFALWGSDQARHPAALYGRDAQVTVAIRSISFIDPDTASLRIRKDVTRGGATASRDYVVTLDFTYARGGDRLIEAIWQNPLGFAVTSYRIDPETIEERE